MSTTASAEKTGPKPLTLDGFPRAIIHLDGDAFSTSVEQSVHPEWKGRPMVTGQERGIIACASYEAKALGIKRGVALWEAQRMCRDLIVVPSDYELYSLYSKRMFEIMRRYTPMVEEHSIDEGFADCSGLRRVFHGSYEDIARQMQQTIQQELDLGVSVGLGPSKSIAKLASKFRKPQGFTAVAGYHLHLFLPRIPLDGIWGFGRNTVQLLQKYGLRTAWDVVQQPEAWIGRLLGKPGREIWRELRGESIYPVNPEEKTTYATISKCKTFTAPSADRDFVYAKLIRNLENAFAKLRRYHLAARTITVALRTQDYIQHGLEARLNRATTATQEAVVAVRALFDELYQPGATYRTTMVVLGKLQEDCGLQYELFEDPVQIDAMVRAATAMDTINETFGKHKVGLGPMLDLDRVPDPTPRDEQPQRHANLLPGETTRKRLAIPRLAIRI